jgi:hypothetical protein
MEITPCSETSQGDAGIVNLALAASTSVNFMPTRWLRRHDGALPSTTART